MKKLLQIVLHLLSLTALAQDGGGPFSFTVNFDSAIPLKNIKVYHTDASGYFIATDFEINMGDNSIRVNGYTMFSQIGIPTFVFIQEEPFIHKDPLVKPALKYTYYFLYVSRYFKGKIPEIMFTKGVRNYVLSKDAGTILLEKLSSSLIYKEAIFEALIQVNPKPKN